MQYLGRSASPPLAPFVERLWYCSEPFAHTRERVLPGGGTMALVVNLADGEFTSYEPETPGAVRKVAGAVVTGTATRSFMVEPLRGAGVVGVHFRPGGAYPFLGISPAEIVDDRVALGDLWGSSGRSLRDQVLEAISPSEQLRVVEAALLGRLRSARSGHPAVRLAVEALRDGGKGERVGGVADHVGLSHRRLVELFEREVGLTPKLYARLQRFHRVKQRIAALGGPPSWATFALDSGYSDQSHMIRDFAQFSGMSPASYLRCRTDETRFDHLVHAYRQQ